MSEISAYIKNFWCGIIEIAAQVVAGSFSEDAETYQDKVIC